ncbi:MAG: DUF4762 family protein [Chania sp.]
MMSNARVCFISLLYKEDVVKKINLFEANSIVGGTCTTVCTIRYVKQSAAVCNALTTCVDKNGNEVSSTTAPTALANCGSLNP